MTPAVVEPMAAEPQALPEDHAQACEAVKRLVEADRVPEARELARRILARWPESREAAYWARVLSPARLLPPRPKVPFPSREDRWAREHAHEYPGCWLYIRGDELVIADPDPARVRAAAAAERGEAAVGLILWVPEEAGAV